MIITKKYFPESVANPRPLTIVCEFATNDATKTLYFIYGIQSMNLSVYIFINSLLMYLRFKYIFK